MILPQGDAHLHFDQALDINIPGHGKDFGARGFFRTHALEPSGAVLDDRRDIGQSFDVIDHRRLAPETLKSPGTAV